MQKHAALLNWTCTSILFHVQQLAKAGKHKIFSKQSYWSCVGISLLCFFVANACSIHRATCSRSFSSRFVPMFNSLFCPFKHIVW
uniref:Uncharacterized protein n=1 Tax=Rhipicephalus zambeziensis TaxID=60191 RepID=A0A224YG26_9ACAR